MLLTSSNKESNVGTHNALLSAQFWYKLKFWMPTLAMLMSLSVIESMSHTLSPKSVIIIEVIILIRVNMLWTVKKNMKALKKRVSEIRPNIELSSVSIKFEINEL